MPTLINDEMKRQIIMDHYQNPRHKISHEKDKKYLTVHSKSLSCIDDINVFLKIHSVSDLVEDASWEGVACAISTASTDILCDLLIGKNKKEALKIIDEYFKMLKEEKFNEELLDEAIAFDNTFKQAARIKCATIGWNAFKELLEKKDEKKSKK